MDIEFENGEYGERAVLRSAWSDQVLEKIRSRQCFELEINHAKGWSGPDLHFLGLLPWLRALKIFDMKIKSIEPVHELHALRALEVMTYCQTPIRFSEFPLLEDCGLEWRPKSESLYECTSLKSLFLNNWTERSLDALSRLTTLESLAILNAPIEKLDGIASLGRLCTLRLANLKNLRSLDGVQNLSLLEELGVNACPKIGSIDNVSALTKLRIIHLNNDGKLESLKPLNSIHRLECVLFYESTNIIDGDLSPLMRQKHLSHVSFRNRRHYSHMREEFGAAYAI
jgi:hypothetical protein